VHANAKGHADHLADKITVTGNYCGQLKCFSVRFNGHFPGRPGLADTRSSVSILDFIGAVDDDEG